MDASSLFSSPPQDAAGVDASHLFSLQLMLSKFEYDGQLNPAFQAGAFSLPITRIAAYMAQPRAPRVVQVSSAGGCAGGRGIRGDLGVASDQCRWVCRGVCREGV